MEIFPQGEDYSSYDERYLPLLGVAVSPLLLRRLCTMLTCHQGSPLNLSRLDSSLGIDGKTTRHYSELLIRFLSA